LKILLIEDDQALNESLNQYLSRELFQVESVFSFSEAGRKNFRDYSLIIMDWNLGDGQGIDLLKEWQKKSLRTPILFLTAKADLADKVLSLESGACDYLTKPFEPRELLARIRVQLRDHMDHEVESLNLGPLKIELRTRAVAFRGSEISLSKTEFELLYFLARHQDQVFSREELLKEVWGYQSMPTTRTVDTHILQLRQKLAPEHFETVHGIGYRLKGFK
jgi:DNA-binding response OmpR family regulator